MNDARLARRYGVLASGALLSKVITFVSAAVIGRALGREGLGIYGTAITLTGFLLIGSNAGLDSIGTREAAKSPAQVSAVARRVLRLRLVLGLILGTLALLSVILARGPVLLALPLCIAGVTLAFRNDWVLIAAGADRAVVTASLMRETVFLILAVAVVATTKSVVAAAWAYVAADLVWAAATQVLARGLAGGFNVAGIGQTSGLLKQGWPIALMGFMSLTYNKIDTPLITWMRGARDAGVYYAAYTVVFAALSIIAPFARLVLPEMAAAVNRDRQETMTMTVRLCLIAATAGAAIGLVLVTSSDLILRSLYGSSFAAGASALNVLGWILVLNFPSSILLQRMVADGKQHALAVIAGIAAAGNVAVNIILIPRLGLVGAALATVVSEALLLLLPILLYAQVYAMLPFVKRMAWVFGAAALAWGLGRIASMQLPLLGVAVALACYGLLLIPLLRSLRQGAAAS